MQKAYPAANPGRSIVSRRDPATIQRALSHIPAQDRDTWLRMGMAVKSSLGEDGFGLWDTWSRTADNYNASDAKVVWRSIKPNGGISIATLFHAAKRHGFRLPASELKRDLAEGKPRKKEAPKNASGRRSSPSPMKRPHPQWHIESAESLRASGPTGTRKVACYAMWRGSTSSGAASPARYSCH
jgi:putative DNA primase/helicase